MLETKDDVNTGVKISQEFSGKSKIETDGLLAWRLQAEEYKRAYQNTVPSSFSLTQKSILPVYQFQSAQGKVFSFTLKPTADDGDCFFSCC